MGRSYIWQLNNKETTPEEIEALDVFCRDSFKAACVAEVDTIDQGLGTTASSKRRAIELGLSDDYCKAWLVPHHAKRCLEHLDSFKRNHVDKAPNAESPLSTRVTKHYPELTEQRGARLDPIFSSDMLDTFSELKAYSYRWDEWVQNYRGMMESVNVATAYMTGEQRKKMTYLHYKGNFLMMYEELVGLLRDLMALGRLGLY